jgi:phage gp46-like protein
MLAAAAFTAVVLTLTSLTSSATMENSAQDQGFRVMNLERRVDQLQSRLDLLERSQQNQVLNAATPNYSTQALQELQQRQILLAEQLVTTQKQMLELKKEIDRVALRDRDQKTDGEKKDTTKPETKPEQKPKVQPKKP